MIRTIIALLSALVMGTAGILPAPSPVQADHDHPSTYPPVEKVLIHPINRQAWVFTETVSSGGSIDYHPVRPAPYRRSAYNQSLGFGPYEIVVLSPTGAADTQDSKHIGSNAECWFMGYVYGGVITDSTSGASKANPPENEIPWNNWCDGIPLPRVLVAPSTPLPTPHPGVMYCNDRVDNDFDGRVDEEYIDGIDNDADGRVDEDTYCPGQQQPTPQPGQMYCGDRIDNDYDGRVDEEYPNGYDDDRDGRIDEDTYCVSTQPSPPVPPAPYPPPATSGCSATPLPSFSSSRWQIWRPAQSYSGVVVVHFWSDWAGDWRARSERRLILEFGERPGLRGGGSAWLYPTGCAEVARAEDQRNAGHLGVVTLPDLRYEGLVE